MRLFRKLANLLGYSQDAVQREFLGLSTEQVDALRDLRASDGWLAYLQLLDNATTLFGEALLGARDDTNLHELRGTILGMRKAARLVDETLAKAKELDDQRTREHERADAIAAVGDATHFGSIGWRRG